MRFHGLGIFLIVVLALAATAAIAVTGPAGWELADPDAYLRMIRVVELHDGAGWFDEITHRIAAPEGLSMHWTRPLDLLILLPGLAAQAVTGAPGRDALLAAGIVVSPALMLGCLLAVAWAARGLWQGRGGIPAALFLAASMVPLSYAKPGRADHHILLLLCLILGLGATIRALSPGGWSRAAWMAGAAFGCGVWVTPEALIVALPVLAATGLAWCLAEDGTHVARQGLRMGLGLGAAALLAFLVERPPSGWFVVAYDRVSVHHLALAAALASVFAVAVPFARCARPIRIGVGAAAVLVAAGALLLAFPGMLLGSLSGADDETFRRLMQPVITEMTPLWPLGDGAPIRLPLLLGGAPVAGILALAAAMPGWRRDGTWPAGLAVAVAMLVSLGAAIGALRLALDLSAPAAIAAGGFPGLVTRAAGSRRSLATASAAVAATVLLLGTPLWAAIWMGPDHPPMAAASCALAPLAAHLDRARPGFVPGEPPPVIMAARFDAGPEIVWRTPYRSAAGPYHRGGRAVLDVHAVFDRPDLAAARDILHRRDVRLLLTCIHDPRTEPLAGTLREAILAGTPPAWLQPVPLPQALGDFRLYLVLPPA